MKKKFKRKQNLLQLKMFQVKYLLTNGGWWGLVNCGLEISDWRL